MLTLTKFLLKKIIWEPLNCGSFWEKVYLRLHENMIEISLKIVNERIYAFQTIGTNYLKTTFVSHDILIFGRIANPISAYGP